MDLAVNAYRFSAQFPRSEMFGLTSQLRRASASVPANIAEGYGRGSTRSYVHFLRTAQGSLKELEIHVILSQRVGFASETDASPVLQQADDVGRMLGSLIRSIERQTEGTI